MRFIVISDTHNQMSDSYKIPDGDVLIHCGDATSMGTIQEISRFNHWLGKLPHKHKIFVPGNHDWLFEKNPTLAREILSHATVLIDAGIEIDGLKIYGSPHQPEYYQWAFNLPRDGHELRHKWDLIPHGLDVLITHSPPYGILDTPLDYGPQGCRLLLEAIKRVKPQIHVFGHIHDGYGMDGHTLEDTLCFNAAICNDFYVPIQQPWDIEVSVKSEEEVI